MHMEKIEKQSNPKVMNLLQRRVNVLKIPVLVNLHQDFNMVKQVLFYYLKILMKVY